MSNTAVHHLRRRPLRVISLVVAAALCAAGLHGLAGWLPARAAEGNGTWSIAGTLVEPRAGHTSTLLPNGKVLLAGGGTNTAELLDPATGESMPTGSMSVPRSDHSATLLDDGRVLVVGGRDGTNTATLASAELYDPGTAGWSAAGSVPHAANDQPAPGRADHTATLLNGKVLVAGGFSAIEASSGAGCYDALAECPAVASAAIYAPPPPGAAGPGSWTAVSQPMSTGRARHSATLISGPACEGPATPLACGKVLMAGGSGFSVPGSQDDAAGATTAELYDPATGTWIATGPLVHNRQGHTAALLRNGQVLVAAGQNCGTSPPPAADPNAVSVCTFTASAELYDPATAKWSPTGSLTSRRFEHTGTLLDDPSCEGQASVPAWCGNVVVAGGQGGAVLSAVEIFDPEAPGRDDAGRPVAGAWTPAGSLVDARTSHAATHLGAGRVLATGGGEAETSVEVFVPGSAVRPPSVTSIDPASGPMSGKTGVVIQGAGFDQVEAVRFGDRDAAFYRVESSSRIIATSPPAARAGAVDVTVTTPGGRSVRTLRDRFTYYETNGTWSATAAMHVPRQGHTAVPLDDGRVLVTGGRAAGGALAPPTATAELFDPATETWAPTGSMSQARVGHTATLLEDGTVLVAGGGNSDDGTDTSEVYDPGTGTWTATPGRMAGSRTGHTATLLPSGKVLVVGGGRGSRRSSSELYDPPSRTWARTEGDLGQPRHSHTATDLGMGRVLVVGGSSSPTTSELYDPGSGTWQAAGGTMEFGRANHTATPLPGGRVLVAGGGTDNAGTDTSEVFDPTSESWAVLDDKLSVPRAEGHTATDLGGGAVLISGGETGVDTTVLAAAQVFDPAARRWLPRLPILSERSGHTATLLSDGRVLLAGGIDNEGIRLAAAEVFDPRAFEARLSLLSLTPSRGSTSGGTEVTITGSGLFHPETRVSFGGLPPKFLSVNSDREIIAVAPAHSPGTVPVTVTTPHGTSRPLTYSYEAGAWSAGAPLNDCRPASTSCAGRGGHHTATALPSGKVLVAGGDAGFPVANSGWAQVYDPETTSWGPAAPMSVPRSRHAAVPLGDGTVLVVGGAIVPTNLYPTGRVAEAYDPGSDTWRPTGLVEIGRQEGHTVTRLKDGKALLAGGQVIVPRREIVLGPLPPAPTPDEWATASTDAAELYDPLTRQWSRTTSLNYSRRNHTATLLEDGRVLLAGGVKTEHTAQARTNTTLNSIERYNATAKAWERVSALGLARSSHTATLLGNGSVLIVGGEGEAGTLASVEIYDPAAGTATATAPLHDGRSGHTATRLSDGRVLVTGGFMNGLPLASSEIYDPATGRWSYAGEMAAGRTSHTATLLQGGRCGSACGTVLVTGNAVSRELAASAELFTAAPEVTAVTPAIGPSAGGTPVVITGRSLDRASAVSFGGVPAATFAVRSPGEIVAVTAPHQAGTVEVVVTTPGGSSLAEPPRPNEFTFVSSGVPGRVADLEARALSEAAVELTWTTAGSDGLFGPPASRYVIKESPSPIDSEDTFAAASTVCDGACSFAAASIGRTIRFSIDGLTPGTSYHYALRAVGPNGVEGPISNPASATTAGTAPVLDTRCPSLPAPGPGQRAYGSGYSMVGLPAGTRVDAQSPLYGWFDLGARGSYTTQAGGDPVAAGRGYWAWFSCPRLVSLTGPGTGSMDLPLGSYRASMVGNPSGTQAVVVSGHDFAARWDPALNGGAGGYHISGHREEQALPVGEASWVFSYRDTTVALRAR